MRTLLNTYPYLVACLTALGVLGVLLLLSPGQRKPALLSGALCTPFGLFSIWLVPTYWNPRWVWSMGGVGIEDLLFSFAAGAWVWILAVFFLRKRLVLRIHLPQVLARYAVIMACGLSCWGIAWKLIHDPMLAVWVSFVVGTLVHLLLRPALWRLTLSGGLGFLGVYALGMKIWLWSLPSFAASWPATVRWNTLFLGIPYGEHIWALTYGACWPLVLAFLFRAEWLPSLSTISHAVSCATRKERI